MRKKLLPGLCAAILLLVIGCATTQPVEKPKRERIRTLIFQLSEQIFSTMLEQGKKRVAVMNFPLLTGEMTELGLYLSDKLTNSLFQYRDKFEVVERTRLESVLKEMKLGVTGIIDDETAQSIGKVLGADAIVTGKITDWREREEVEISIRMLGTEKANVVAKASSFLKKDDDITRFMRNIIRPKTETVKPKGETPPPLKSVTLTVKANVSGARILIDGQEVGYTPLTDVEVSPGEHRIRVEKDGYEPYREWVLFEPGQTRYMYVPLREIPRKGCLFVETKPKNALVRILNIKLKFYQGIELEPGQYYVEVSADGYEKESTWVKLHAGETKNLDIRLKRVAEPLPETPLPRPEKPKPQPLPEIPISPEEAPDYIGKEKTVCGTVIKPRYAYHKKGKPTFLNLDEPYPDHIFTVVIWGRHRHKFGRPEEFYDGKRICVTGTIFESEYDGKPRIKVTERSQIKP